MPRKAKFKPLTRLQILRRINDYARALVAESWAGSVDPADMPRLEQDLAEAFERVLHALDNIDAMRAEIARLKGE